MVLPAAESFKSITARTIVFLFEKYCVQTDIALSKDNFSLIQVTKKNTQQSDNYNFIYRYNYTTLQEKGAPTLENVAKQSV